MAFFSLPVEAKDLAHAIPKFQRETGNKKASRINSALQKLVDRVVAIKLINLPLLNVSKRKTRAATSTFSRFYNSSWLTNADKFPETVAHFKEITAHSQIMDSSLQQSITSAVTSAVVTGIADIQAKYEGKMLSLREMIKKSLLLKESPSATPPPDSDTTSKAHHGVDSLLKAITKRWNQADLSYFKPHLDRAHGKGEIVLVGKDIYYKNIVLFVQRFQSLVTF